jgi:hypothetical protein
VGDHFAGWLEALCLDATALGDGRGIADQADSREMTRLIPKVFFNHLSEGLDLFAGCLGFQVLYKDESLAVVARDTAKAYLVESPEFAAKDRPEITIETDTIEAFYTEISSRRPEMLHPNSKVVAKKPWGAQEFAVRDKTDVCIVFRQW